MSLKLFVTFLVASVLLLVSKDMAWAANNNTITTTAKKKTFQPPKEVNNWIVELSFERSTNLIDFEDGSRSDSMSYSLKPSYKMAYGNLSTTLVYIQNLRDSFDSTTAGLADIPISFSFKTDSWTWNDSQKAKFNYSLTTIIPASQYSVKKDLLQTAISGRAGFSVMPSSGEGFAYSTGLSVGRNFHTYSEDINNVVLNQYSASLSMGADYARGDWNIGANFSYVSRWTYHNNVKTGFKSSEKIGYTVNKNISLAVGHSNEGSTLKPNGIDSNIEVFNENNSTVYLTLGLIY